jgi:hypothetical protein
MAQQRFQKKKKNLGDNKDLPFAYKWIIFTEGFCAC